MDGHNRRGVEHSIENHPVPDRGGDSIMRHQTAYRMKKQRKFLQGEAGETDGKTGQYALGWLCFVFDRIFPPSYASAGPGKLDCT